MEFSLSICTKIGFDGYNTPLPGVNLRYGLVLTAQKWYFAVLNRFVSRK